jgi:hypothetical protein
MWEVSQMTLLYAQVPLALLSNPRVRDLPPSAELTLFRLYLHATLCSSTRDTIPLPRGVAYAQAVRSLVGEHVDRIDALVSAGLVAYEADALRLTLTHSAPCAAPPSRVEAPVGAPTGGRERSVEASKEKPSDGAEAKRARSDRALFKARDKGFWADIHPDTTWEAWIASPDGVAFIVSREAKFPGYTRWVTPQGNAGNTPEVTRVTPSGNAPSLPPHTPLSLPENKKNGDEEGNARDAGNTPRVTPRGNTPTPSILSGLQAAAKGATLTGALAMEREANATLARITPPLSADEIEDMGAALANPSAWWPPGKKAAPKHITLRDLAGWRGDDGAHDWTPLMALVAHARAGDDDGYINRPDPPRPPQIVKILQGDEITRALEEAETTGPFAWALRGRKRATVQGG